MFMLEKAEKWHSMWTYDQFVSTFGLGVSWRLWFKMVFDWAKARKPENKEKSRIQNIKKEDALMHWSTYPYDLLNWQSINLIPYKFYEKPLEITSTSSTFFIFFTSTFIFFTSTFIFILISTFTYQPNECARRCIEWDWELWLRSSANGCTLVF